MECGQKGMINMKIMSKKNYDVTAHDFNELNKVEYLGDGVYVDIGNWGYIKLMSDDHINPTNVIYLDESTFKALVEFVKVHAEAWLREE